MMNRFISTLRLDMTLQWRNGFYMVSAIVAVFVIAVLRVFIPPEYFPLALPAFFLGALAVTTYMFAGGMLLFEKGQRTLEAQIISPLSTGEYLIARAASLSLLATIESLAIALVVLGPDPAVNWPLLALGLLAMSAFYVLVGLAIVVRYESVTDFLMPSVVITGIMELPLFGLFNIGPAWLYYLFPVQPSLLLMRWAFVPLSGAQIAYALIGSALAIGLAAWWAQRAFTLHIIRSGRDA